VGFAFLQVGPLAERHDRVLLNFDFDIRVVLACQKSFAIRGSFGKVQAAVHGSLG
jgi:hypothetical protein